MYLLSRLLIALSVALFFSSPSALADEVGNYRGLAREGKNALEDGDLNLAESKLLKAQKKAKIAGPLYTFYAESLLNLGALYDRQKKVEQSKSKYDEALKIYTKAYGETTLQAAKCYQGLGELYRHNKKYLKSIPFYSKAIKIRKKAAPNHPTTAESAYGLAKTFIALKQYGEAQPYLKDVVAIQEKVYGSNDKRMVRTLYELAKAYEGAGKLNLAIPTYKRVVSILSTAYGPSNARIASTHERLGSAYLRVLQYKRAEASYSKALKIREKNKNNLKTKQCIKGYLKVLKKQKKTEDAKRLEDRLAKLK